MKQNELKPPIGAKHRSKRVGRGDGSGHGSYSGRGSKGQKARSGGGVRLGFEGGQLPLIKRLPENRGFTNIFRVECNIVNAKNLNVFPPGSEITPKELFQAGLIKSLELPTKILGDGDIRHSLSVKANKFSATAEKKIIAAGGKVEKI
ncbi:MAG: 50S ribosomal protein L15 [Chloroflexi bacterium CG08_land_8_20_14_0_20_45_12]|nr:MAG: 50S ribosomal protein L15 [Chloroflexi bacterium CG08_land_8_20_14_0_20_45_12]